MKDTFARVVWYRRGYNTEEVDRFFERARAAYEGGIPSEQFSSTDVASAVFSVVRGGYVSRDVDAALARMARAFIVRDRDDHIAVNGHDAWMERVTRRATALYPRMIRPAGERFAHPHGKGYRCEDVDKLIDRLARYFDSGEPIRIEEVAGAVFKAARNERAYDEAVVDAYLDRAVEVLQSVA